MIRDLPRGRFARLASFVSLSLIVFAFASADGVDPDLWAGMKARAIGPAAMSGRIAAIDVDLSNRATIWAGAATGGAWKSVDAGLTWTPVFEKERVAAVGSIAIDQTNPDVVWLGTGEGNPRNSASVGDGIFKTIDGGKSWTHLGLEGTERIHRIRLDPRDTDVAYAAALGPSWGEGDRRGVFKTTDGGASWSRILYVGDTTGAADLAMDPSNPNRLLAAMWDHRRWPWFFRSGGPGSGLYLTEDGGETWEKLTPEDGLPEGELGRIGVAFAPSDPDVVYAFVEAEKNAIFRSGDGGRSWAKINEAGDAIGNRPFYYADLRVDPKDSKRVYSLWSVVSVSEDAGNSFRVIIGFGKAHPDHHELWIDPDDPRHMINGNDGGIAITRDRGETWRFVSNLPVGQFYHVRVDDDVPYNVYGGMQDNGSWRGPSRVLDGSAIRNHHWQEVDFGDGFDTLPDTNDSMQGWSMSQEGFLKRWNLRTGEKRDVRPIGPEGEELRFNWSAGLAIDPFDPRTIYYGSQFVHRSRDRGDSWEIISGDLTTDEPEWQKQAESGGLTLDVTGAENFTSIVTIAPSPLKRGVIWVGTDDGRVHVTRDGGENWESVEKNVRGVPDHTWVPHIEPSRADPAVAYVVFDNHRRSDWTPYVFRASGYGSKWKSLAGEGDVDGYALSIAQDDENRDLLFLGTEFGLWISRNGGDTWEKWTHGVPTVSVMDMAMQRRTRDLVLGTHGRAFFVIDDVSPLAEMTGEIATSPLHLFSVRPVHAYARQRAASSRFHGQGEFRGENRAYGATFSYWMTGEDLAHPDDDRERARKEAKRAADADEEKSSDESDEAPGKASDEVAIRITDEEGNVLREMKGPARQGLNRAVWNLRRDAFAMPRTGDDEESFFEQGGPELPPGVYGVEIEHGDHLAEGTVEVLPDPRSQVSGGDRRAAYDALVEIGELQERLTGAIDRLRTTRAALADVDERLDARKRSSDLDEEPEDEKRLRGEVKVLREKIDALEKTLWQPPGIKGIVAETDAMSKLRRARFLQGISWAAPTEAHRERFRRVRVVVDDAVESVDRFLTDEVEPLAERVEELGLRLVPTGAPAS